MVPRPVVTAAAPELLLLIPSPLPVMVLNFLPLWEQHQHFQLGLLLPRSL